MAITEKNKQKIIENVVCVIITDGIENASILFDIKMINSLINKMKDKHNWKFIYLGANHDAFAIGGSIGIDKSQCSEYVCNSIELPKLMKSTSGVIRDFRNCRVDEIKLDNEDNKPNTQKYYYMNIKTPVKIKRPLLKRIITSEFESNNISKEEKVLVPSINLPFDF